jgi:hypothetical protein
MVMARQLRTMGRQQRGMERPQMRTQQQKEQQRQEAKILGLDKRIRRRLVEQGRLVASWRLEILVFVEQRDVCGDHVERRRGRVRSRD